MPALIPFRAWRNTKSRNRIFVPGEESSLQINRANLTQDNAPALYLYRQLFGGEHRDGVIGLLGDTDPFPHEQTFPHRVDACRTLRRKTKLEASSLFLWCNDDAGTVAPLLQTTETPLIEARDHFGCLHQIWRAPQTEAIQAALANKPLFLADGHHRLAAGWSLATIQIRTPALRTLPAHRLVLYDNTLTMPPTQPIEAIDAFWAATPPGFVRFGVITPHQLLGIEIARAPQERNISALHSRVLHNATVLPIRNITEAQSLVQSGVAKFAFLVEPLSIDDIERDARNGILLPPKSTDFYPKLAAGLIMHAH